MDINKLQEIIEKVNQLGLKNKALMEENQLLKNENKALKLEIETKNIDINALIHEIDDNQGAMSEQKKRGAGKIIKLKKEIDQYVDEINQCIEWLDAN